MSNNIVTCDGKTRFLIKRTIRYLYRNPEKHLPKMAHKVNGMVPDDLFPSQRAQIMRIIDDKDNWYQLIMSVFDSVDPKVLCEMTETFGTNGSFIGYPEQCRNSQKYGCNIPWAILLDPTSACNLHCTGCWAAEYGNKLNLSREDIQSIIDQGKELGTFVYIYTGGEPLMRKKDLIGICEDNQDCMFMCFTNATLIDDGFCDDIARVGNFLPVVSVEGTRESTDARRGKGTYDKIVRAFERMKAHRLIYGISCCNTHENVDVVSSEAFYDQMIAWGARFCWFFAYMPVGNDADTRLMNTAEDRRHMYERVRAFRATKPLLTLDFFNDGEYVGGCIAGGRRYLHINANGDVDPCVFIHYSDSNIHEKTLLECLRAPLFQAYHDNQPFNANMLRPCPVLDNPGRLTEMVNATEAHSTEMLSPETPEHYTAKCEEAAKAWAPVSEELWKSKEHNPALWTDYSPSEE